MFKMSLLQIQNKENELILNTPNRLEILKEGPPTNQSKTNLLGKGTYGTVMKAIYKAKPVAVKIIKNLEQDANKATTLGETHVLGWQHPNIVRILKIETTANFSLVVMERFTGHCLQKVLETIELPLRHRVFIALDILTGLNYCHKNLLLHLDIKPQNIMVQMKYPKPQEKLISNKFYRSYKCKLCDFGSSIKISKQNPQTTGLTKGTLRYMAPEILKEEHLSAAADVYAFGIMLWQMSHRLTPYHWLECNEVVAYQVVKHKLRPNTLQSSISDLQKSSENCHNNCRCETISDNLSYHSLEHLRNILNKTKCALITERSVVDRPVKKMEPQRKPLQNFNNNTNSNRQKLNVKRDLHSDFILNDAFALQHVFKEHCGATSVAAAAHLRHKEQMYEQIFESCWNSDFNHRPTTGELCRHFKELL